MVHGHPIQCWELVCGFLFGKRMYIIIYSTIRNVGRANRYSVGEAASKRGPLECRFFGRGPQPSVSAGESESRRGPLRRPPFLGVGRDRLFPVGRASQGVGHLGPSRLLWTHRRRETYRDGPPCAKECARIKVYVFQRSVGVPGRHVKLESRNRNRNVNCNGNHV